MVCVKVYGSKNIKLPDDSDILSNNGWRNDFWKNWHNRAEYCSESKQKSKTSDDRRSNTREFYETGTEKVRGLFESGTSHLAVTENNQEEARIYASLFVAFFKLTNKRVWYKSRTMSKHNLDNKTASNSMKVSAIRRYVQRNLPFHEEYYDYIALRTMYIGRMYTQFLSCLARRIQILHLAKMKLHTKGFRSGQK